MNITSFKESLPFDSRTLCKIFGMKHNKFTEIIENTLSKYPNVKFEKLSDTYKGTDYSFYKFDNQCLILTMNNLKHSKFDSIKEQISKSVSDLSKIVEALDNFEVPEEFKDMFIYVIRNEVTGNIKLGISRDPERRLKELQTGNDCTLKLITYFKANNGFADERALHDANKEHRVLGEWFLPTASVL